jgi:hypothetical protein
MVSGSGSGGRPVWDAVGCLTAAVDGLAGAGWWRCGDAELLDLQQGLETAARRLSAASLRLVAEVDDRRLATARGVVSTAALLRQLLNISAGEAGWRVTAAETLLDRVGPSGETVPAALPATGAALAAGVIEAGQARLICETIRRLPARVDTATREQAERFLAGQARDLDTTALGKLARRMVATLDPDGAALDDEDAVGARELSLSRDPDGMTVLRGRLDAEGAAVLRSALDPFTAPTPSTAEGPDPRSPGRRQADGLIELARRALTAADLPETGGQRPQVTITLDWECLRQQLGTAELGWGGPVTPATARRIACDAQVIPVLLGGVGQPLDVGRASHTIPVGIRRALAARDRGCAFPGCDRPAAWCDGHHITHWADGGPTALTNLVLLCGHHHRTIHHHGWQTRIADGIPEFLPPPWIDPDQTPRRNRLHHLPAMPDPPPTGRRSSTLEVVTS